MCLCEFLTGLLCCRAGAAGGPAGGCLQAANAGGVLRQLAPRRRAAGAHGGQDGAPPLARLRQRLLHDLQRDALHL